MLTSLDWLIIVFMVLAAASVLALALMFLIKNKTVKRVCLYIVAALSVYLGYVGLRINWPDFMTQVSVAVLVVLAGIGALVLERLAKDHEKRFQAAQIMAAGALVIGMINAFML